ncbi:MAG: hypothetical protein JSS00_09185 [Proteobacteria bacterium]|nr:hypothetical protein [Pseudomonadota bacterium]
MAIDKLALAASAAFVLALAACGQAATTTQTTTQPAAPPLTGDAALIQSAMSAAPAAVAQDATIMTMNADGSMRQLRAGHNGFTCIPDSPATPGPDPMCADTNAMGWVDAWIHHRTPPAGKVGFMYMLAGGTDASNTDPYATAPSSQNHWVQTGPHVMVLNAPSLMQTYPRNVDPDTSKPYVMWAGTPYEHLMIPVR